ncbi:MAG TPA: hypothetical protein DCQ79_10880, partial [Rhizobiales bacterium]|nr:hypothetical protein [Hyphomicrobiales bacterium]
VSRSRHVDFREHIQESLKRCDILVAIVGPRWAAPDEQGRPRIRDETDWVRIEIEAALAKKIPVIPVLIDGTALPPPFELPEGLRDLAFRQAAPVDSGRDFHPHIDRLIKAMDQLLARGNPAVPPEAPKAATKSTEARVANPKDRTVATANSSTCRLRLTRRSLRRPLPGREASCCLASARS